MTAREEALRAVEKEYQDLFLKLLQRSKRQLAQDVLRLAAELDRANAKGKKSE